MVKTLLETALLLPRFEITVCECPPRMIRELNHVFPDKGPSMLRAVATMQHANMELARWGEDVEAEKDALLEKFLAFSAAVSEYLIREGHWADYIDPCSGLPMVNHSNNVYSEVDGMQTLLGYSVQNAGFCKILLHPTWGSAVFPATLFTNASLGVITESLAAGKDAIMKKSLESSS